MLELHGDSPRAPVHDDALDVLRPGGPTPTLPSPRRSVGTWLVVLGLVAAAVAAWFITVRGPGNRTAPPAAERAAAAEAPPDALRPLGREPANITVPPLDESDAVVRELVRGLTTHPTVAAWLATDGLIRNFTVSVVNVADGATPARHLRAVRPSTALSVTREGDRLAIAPASYRRYDTFAAALASIDPYGAARLYATLKPRITEAYRDLGHPDGAVDSAVEKAIVQLLETPVVADPLWVQPATRGIGYTFVDPRLESLSGAQKQMLRMGPENVRSIQGSLRALALALGIPPGHLPPAPQSVQE